MTTFAELEVGDMCDTKAARYVKVDANDAVVVMSGVFRVGNIRPIPAETDVTVIWSKKSDAEKDALIAEQQATIDRWQKSAADEQRRRTFGMYNGPLAEVT